MKAVIVAAALSLGVLTGCQTAGPDAAEDGEAQQLTEAELAFAQAMELAWEPALVDDGKGDWTEHWFLDGEKAQVINSENGMDFIAGPIPDENASHAVLWTRQTFEAPIKIEYDYTRTDRSHRGVNLLYMLATGSGEPPYVADIYEWRELRAVPTMGKYFSNMNLYAISYAVGTYAEDQTLKDDGYVRGRRYMPEGGTLRGTNFEPDYRGEGLFRQGVPHSIVVIKHGKWMFMRVSNADQEQLFSFDTSSLPEVSEGRVGFRHMFTRSARYANVTISQIQE
jgi:hypothetical protein